MKKVFKTLFIAVCFILAFNFVTVNKSEASVSSNKSDLVTVVRTQEGDKNYITIYVDNVMIMKVEEL